MPDGVMAKLAWLAVLACGCGSRPASQTIAGVLHAPLDGPGVAARVEVDFEPSKCGFLSAKCAGSEGVTHVLKVDDHGRHRESMLILVVPGGYDDSTSSRDYERLRTAKYEIAVSDDGHALALRLGKLWRYVGLDAPTPLFCIHRTSSAPSWAISTRDLALEILRSKSAPAAIDHTKRVYERTGDEFGRELRAAATYAVAHADDQPLGEALAVALVTPCPGGGLECDTGFGANASELAETDAEIATAGGQLARSKPLQQIYRHAVASTLPSDDENQFHALEGLGFVANTDTERFLFDTIATVRTTDNMMSDPEFSTCLLRIDALRSIAHVIATTRSAPDADVDKLIAWADRDSLCTGLDAAGGPGGRAYAAFALAALRAPKARRELQQLAAAPCANPVELGATLPTIWDERWNGPDQTSCWARGALAR